MLKRSPKKLLMLNLDSPTWELLEGGYRQPYNPVAALRRLEEVSSPKEEAAAFKELWDELHHQGDVGACSYACVPHLVRIAESRPPMTSDFFALVSVIEIERHELQNPEIPQEYRSDYLHALEKIPTIIAQASPQEWDESMISSTCAALSAAKGNRLLARAFLEMSEIAARSFLREETGYE